MRVGPLTYEERKKIRDTRLVAGLRIMTVRSACLREGRLHFLPPSQLDTVRACRKTKTSDSQVLVGFPRVLVLVFFLASEKARAYFAGIELLWVALAVKEDGMASPVDVSLLSPEGIVQRAELCRSQSSSRTAAAGRAPRCSDGQDEPRRRCHNSLLPSSKFAKIACTAFFGYL